MSRISLKNFWLVFKKELKHSFRDKDVLLYTFLMPFLIYPISAFLAIETSMVTQGRDKEQVLRIAQVTPRSQATDIFGVALAEAKIKAEFFPMDRTAALDSLHRGDRDFILAVSQDDKVLTVTAAHNFTDAVLGFKLQNALNTRHDAMVDKSLKAAGFGPVAKERRVFEIDPVNLHPRKQQSYSPAFMLFLISLLMMALGAAYPAVSATAEEHERKTIESTMLLPVSRGVIMVGKLASIALFAFITVSINFLSIAAIAMLALVSLRHFHKFDMSLFLSPVSFLQVLYITFGLFLTSICVGAIMLFAASFCRTIRAAQNWVALPLMLVMLAPMASLIPNMVLTPLWAAVPFFGMVLFMRDAFTSEVFALPQVIACVSTTVAVVLLTLASSRLMFEDFGLPRLFFMRKPLKAAPTRENEK